MPQTSTVRNLLISFGAFWLSLMTVWPFVLLFGKFTSRFIYGDGVLDAILAGAMESTGRTLAAIFGGLLVLIFADSAKKLRWAFIVPILYVLDAPFRSFHWKIQPTRFDRMWQGIYLIFPAIACAVCIAVVDHLRRLRTEPERTNSRYRTLLIASFVVAITAASASAEHWCHPERLYAVPWKDLSSAIVSALGSTNYPAPCFRLLPGAPVRLPHGAPGAVSD
jgi:hypothetical protein